MAKDLDVFWYVNVIDGLSPSSLLCIVIKKERHITILPKYAFTCDSETNYPFSFSKQLVKKRNDELLNKNTCVLDFLYPRNHFMCLWPTRRGFIYDER